MVGGNVGELTGGDAPHVEREVRDLRELLDPQPGDLERPVVLAADGGQRQPADHVLDAADHHRLELGLDLEVGAQQLDRLARCRYRRHQLHRLQLRLREPVRHLRESLARRPALTVVREEL
eukprot:SAG11_NODE_2563_length_3218_cov_8.710484_4_plen_121_part_00